MAKKIPYIVLGIGLVILASIIILMAFLYQDKEPLSANEFVKIMQKEDFAVTDVTVQFSDDKFIKKVYVAKSSEHSYQIKFYELSDEDYAKRLFNNTKLILKSSKGNRFEGISLGMKNWTKYTLSTDRKYKRLSRIGNTIVFVGVDSEYKGTVKDVLDKLEY